MHYNRYPADLVFMASKEFMWLGAEVEDHRRLSTQEYADSKLASQIQLHEVLEASLRVDLERRQMQSREAIKVRLDVDKPSTSRPYVIPAKMMYQERISSTVEQEPLDTEWPYPLLYNFTTGKQCQTADMFNEEILQQDHDDLIQALSEESRLFNLRDKRQNDLEDAFRLPWSSPNEGVFRGIVLTRDIPIKSSDPDVVSNFPYHLRYPRQSKVNEETFPDDAKASDATCNICLTTKITSKNSCVVSQKCRHTFCTDCLRQHGETIVKSGKPRIPCPEYKCEETWSAKMCELLLSADTLRIHDLHQVEDALQDWERVYCPYKDCSSLQLKPQSHSPRQPSVVRGVQCLSCNRNFCLECKVPWHENLTCEEYKRLPENEKSPQDIALLQGLAEAKKWQRCSCGHVVERSYGCNHIICRCGKEFCYICGEDWKGHSNRRMFDCRRRQSVRDLP